MFIVDYLQALQKLSGYHFFNTSCIMTALLRDKSKMLKHIFNSCKEILQPHRVKI